MRKTIGTVIIMLTMIATSAYAGNEKKETFAVKGNCGMCEKTIEKAAKNVEGVTEADWDVKAKKITVTYDESKTNLDTIHKAIADTGYDTDKVKAKDEVYNKLHGCCKYEREDCTTEKKKGCCSGHKH